MSPIRAAVPILASFSQAGASQAASATENALKGLPQALTPEKSASGLFGQIGKFAYDLAIKPAVNVVTDCVTDFSAASCAKSVVVAALTYTPLLDLAGGVVDGYRAAAITRQMYVDGAKKIASDGLERVANGESPSLVARESVAARNALKVATRQNTATILARGAEVINQIKYGDKVGKSYEIYASYKTDMQIIRGSGKTSQLFNSVFRVKE